MKKKQKQNLILLGLIILDIVLLTFIFLFVSCRSIEYVNPKLPIYELENIERPTITEKSEDIILLMRYAEKKEIQLTNFYNFYESLRQAQK